jgi:KDO2-lipid IV(A) lauroyltransferase
VVNENLRHAFPEKSPAELGELSRRMWEHLFLLVLEVAHAPRKIHETNWRDFVQLEQEARLVRMLISQRPTILISGHFGNFELGGYILGVLGFPTYSVARRLDNPYLDRFVNRFRGATGQYIIPKKGGYDQILEVLSSGGVIAFLADQYAGAKGCWVEFFGRPASAHKAIALLALNNDAPLVVSYSKRLDRPLRLELATTAVADPADAGSEVSGIKDLTQWYTTQLEEIIARNPEQYWWVHRRWKDPRTRRRSRVKKAA